MRDEVGAGRADARANGQGVSHGGSLGWCGACTRNFDFDPPMVDGFFIHFSWTVIERKVDRDRGGGGLS